MLPRSLQDGESARADLVDRALAGNLAVARRTRVALRGPLRIVVDQGPGLLLVDLEAPSHGLLLVVFALHQRLARQIVPAGGLRRVEADVVVPARRRVHAAPRETPDDLVVVDVDLQHEVESDVRGAHRLSLGDGARKSVEQVAVPAIQVLEALFHEADDDVVGDELPGVHDLLGGESERRARLHGSAQHVAGGDLGNPEVIADKSRLGALAGSRRPEKNEPHSLVFLECPPGRLLRRPGADVTVYGWRGQTARGPARDPRACPPPAPAHPAGPRPRCRTRATGHAAARAPRSAPAGRSRAWEKRAGTRRGRHRCPRAGSREDRRAALSGQPRKRRAPTGWARG